MRTDVKSKLLFHIHRDTHRDTRKASLSQTQNYSPIIQQISCLSISFITEKKKKKKSLNFVSQTCRTLIESVKQTG